MSFLPKTAEQSGHQVLDFLIALPLTLLGTGFIYFLLQVGTHGASL